MQYRKTCAWIVFSSVESSRPRWQAFRTIPKRPLENLVVPPRPGDAKRRLESQRVTRLWGCILPALDLARAIAPPFQKPFAGHPCKWLRFRGRFHPIPVFQNQVIWQHASIEQKAAGLASKRISRQRIRSSGRLQQSAPGSTNASDAEYTFQREYS